MYTHLNLITSFSYLFTHKCENSRHPSFYTGIERELSTVLTIVEIIHIGDNILSQLKECYHNGLTLELKACWGGFINALATLPIRSMVDEKSGRWINEKSTFWWMW